jgi:hypothetical protein
MKKGPRYLLKAILLLGVIQCCLSPAFAQTPAPIFITGKVTGENGAALAGITITEKGTGNNTVSDTRGAFRIKVSKNNTALVFTAVNYTSQEVQASSADTVKVALVEKTKELDDVVVIGYATTSRKYLTGSVSSVGASQLKDIPTNSAIQALTGRLAGVNISTTEGGPGAAVTIKVRGGGSITQDNTPLYVVDGIQMEDALSNLSPTGY